MREASRVRVASLLQLAEQGPPLALPRAWLLEELKCLWYVILVKWRIEEEFEINCVAGKAGSESHWYRKGSCMYWAVPLCSGE